MGFSELGLSATLCETIASLGYSKPTPVQQQAIPLVLEKADIVACAQTGTGKTAAFLLPLVQILLNSPSKARLPRAIVLEPTRELAMQVFQNFQAYAKTSTLKAVLLVGGESFSEQEKILQRGVDVLIATPGRLLDWIERGKIMLLDTKYVVIDEADRMLDMGFIPDVNRLMAFLPRKKQTLLFSATLPGEVRKLIDTYLVHPKEISITPEDRTAATIEQHYIPLDVKEKREAVRFLLSQYGAETPSIIFCNRKRDVSTLVTSLARCDFKVAALHGDLAQSLRNQTLKDFKDGTISILVASDIAARGLDVEKLGLVINFDVPIYAEDYVHRIGRTGRAGLEGKAFTLVTDADEKSWHAVEKFIQQSISAFEVPKTALEGPKKEKRAPATRSPSPRPPAKVRESKPEQPEKRSPAQPKAKVAEPKRIHSVVNREVDNERVLGFGESVPAFMLKAVVLSEFQEEALS